MNRWNCRIRSVKMKSDARFAVPRLVRTDHGTFKADAHKSRWSRVDKLSFDEIMLEVFYLGGMTFKAWPL